ncbi:FAD dependent oxidoreductase [Pseudonocardia hierapolitana]|uniref:FAD dependent oxidoreductase n=1 Tax=Pseudonocardia hierapolitana TaxID=1128676 RepID=A0A561SY74_9PSEU|nr:FAD-dependent oxidoreductase [Pseudonocardia hierapolitana]TWF79825.1 FAD dependent oxidoreductase [Pseudonocardia hierapolitana]
MTRVPGELEADVPCPPSLLEPSPTTDTPTLTIDVAVVGAGPAGAATAWHLARRGLRVVLLERRTAGAVWRSAGPAAWTEAGLPTALAAEAMRLWRQVEQETGAALLHVSGEVRQVRADQATAALTAAATAWGAHLRHCDEVVAIDGSVGGRLVRTRTATLAAARVVLAGAGPAALVTDAAAPVVTVAARGCFAVPALTAAVAH